MDKKEDTILVWDIQGVPKSLPDHRLIRYRLIGQNMGHPFCKSCKSKCCTDIHIYSEKIKKQIFFITKSGTENTEMVSDVLCASGFNFFILSHYFLPLSPKNKGEISHSWPMLRLQDFYLPLFSPFLPQVPSPLPPFYFLAPSPIIAPFLPQPPSP